MRSVSSLRAWIQHFLPTANADAQEGAWQLMHALLTEFTVSLCGLARQLERTSRGGTARQYLSRWLGRPAWNPLDLYARLPAVWPRTLRRARELPLLIDCTILGEAWCVLQVSLPWQGRALPVYRVVVHYRTPELGQTELLYQALTWLQKHLPGSRPRYVLVMDRGFPSHALIKHLQTAGWRYVLRIGSNWRITHADYTGRGDGWFVGPLPPGVYQQSWFGSALLGTKSKGQNKWSRSHVVICNAAAQQEVWVLATSEGTAAAALRIYRQRMQIEAEFRDIKGPMGLDHLQHWQDPKRVARLLAWIAVYEWRLALLWLSQPLADWGRTHLQVGGRLSWINITRRWVKHHLLEVVGQRTLVRESP